MKNLLVALVFIIFANQALAQFKAGINAGVPGGNISDNNVSDFYNFTAGLDLYYMFGESKDALIKLGVTSGVINYFGDELTNGESVDNAQIIPIAAAGRITFLSTLIFGFDLGYGIGLNIEDNGGPYGRTVLGIDLGNVVEVNAIYHLAKITNGPDFATLGLGVLVVF